MTVGSGAQVIAAPPVAPPRISLLGAVLRPAEVPEGWMNGITFSPEAADATLAADGYWWDPCIPGASDPSTVEGGPGTKTAGSRPAHQVFRPWAVVEGDTCSAADFRRGDFSARARRLLEAATPAKVEHEFWTGQIVELAGFPNRYLASADADVLNGGAAAPLPHALSDLQDYLASTITGRGTIHCTPGLANLWLSAGLIRREANVWLDVKDNLVVPGDGYTGSGPPDETAAGARSSWAYATSMVHYLEEPAATVIPGSLSEALDKATNTVTWRAERVVLPFFDLLAHGAVLVDHCSTCCTEIS